MRTRLSYLVSGLTHAVLFWALAAADDLLRPEFAVRTGQAVSPVSPALQARSVAEPLDTRLTPDPEAVIELEAPPFPRVAETSPPPSSPTSADLDHRVVKRPPIEETVHRRTERSMEVALLPDAAPVALDRPETTPESEGRPLTPLWLTVPEQQTPQPERSSPDQPPAPARPVAVVDVVEPGNAAVSAPGADAPQGATVDRLPAPLPSNPEPEYPDEYRRRQIGGRVLLWLRIDATGRVEDVRVQQSSGHPPLDQSAMSTVRQWRFEPARRAGRAVPFEVRLPITFSIRLR